MHEEVVLVRGVAVPHADQGLDGLEREELVEIDDSSRGVEVERSVSGQQPCEFFEPWAKAVVRLDLEFCERVGDDVGDRSLIEPAAIRAEHPRQKRPLDRLDVCVNTEQLPVDGDGGKADAGRRHSRRPEQPVGQKLSHA